MKVIRGVNKIWRSRPTVEGAGVRLQRAIGPTEVRDLDPFLLLDDFHSEDPADYIAGFPWHPHRGIETVTYVIRGTVQHGDTMGNKGTIGSGDIQWMAAGRGILHEEMPREYTGMMQGFQLWVNLPASHKMMGPRYRDVRKEQIPSFSPSKGIDIQVVAGKVTGTKGPVKDLVVEAEYLDVTLAPDKQFKHEVTRGNTVFGYLFKGDGSFSGDKDRRARAEDLVLFKDGDEVVARSGKAGVRFLLVSGRPLNEPVAWRGPIVMNTEEELDLAFREYWAGTFVKHDA